MAVKDLSQLYRSEDARIEGGTAEEVDQPNPPRPRLFETLENVSHLETVLFDDRASLYSLESDLPLSGVEE